MKIKLLALVMGLAPTGCAEEGMTLRQVIETLGTLGKRGGAIGCITSNLRAGSTAPMGVIER